MTLPYIEMGPNRQPHSISEHISRTTGLVEDPAFERFLKKWPILSAKLLNIYGLKCYGPEQQPYIKNAEQRLEALVKSGEVRDKGSQMSYWLTPGIPPTIDQDLTYVDKKRLEVFSPKSPFLMLALEMFPDTSVSPGEEAMAVTTKNFAAEHQSTLDLLNQHTSPSAPNTSFRRYEEYTD